MAKICAYSVATHLGGAERSLLEYLRHVQKNTQDSVDLLLPKNEGPLITEARKLGIEPSILPFPSALLQQSRHVGRLRFLLSTACAIPASLLYLARLTLYFRRSAPAVVYTSGLKCHVLGSLAGFLSGRPVVWHLRDHIPPGSLRWLLRALHTVLPRLRIAANSKSTADCVPFASRPFVVYNGIDPEQFAFARTKQLHVELNLNPSTKIIGIVGVLARWKGQTEFLRMARKLLDHHEQLHFVVVGDQIYDTSGDVGYRESLLALASELGIASQVSFLGFRMDTVNIIQSLDVLVHASVRPEPFGRVIIEALACGTPVTASALGGPIEILLPGQDGLLHAAGNVEQMATNVEKLLAEDFSQALAARGREKVLRSFTHAAYATSLHEFVLAPENRPKSATKESATATCE